VGGIATNRANVVRLSLLFGALYFVQGIAEPTEGLIAQPVRSLLTDWGQGVAQVATFSALIGLPWAIKPLYGMLTDHVPIFGRRRKSYLLITIGAATLALGYLSLVDIGDRSTTALLWCLSIATLGVAFADVVVDALMVERGQPAGQTGTLQSVQWAAIYGGTILAGWVGGQLSESHQQQLGFAICAAALAFSFVLCLFSVREPRATGRADFQTAARQLALAVRLPVVWSAGGFIFLWNFNPFLTAVLQFHMTENMSFSQSFYGETISLQAIASVVASVAYGFYCRKVSFRALLHMSITLGIASTLAYWLLRDSISARWISLVAGFTYMSALLVQLDLAARVCPLASAGTVFALLMALSNLSLSLATGFGGICYAQIDAHYGPLIAFNVLVGMGALFTAGCWLLLPLVERTLQHLPDMR